jgi:sugar phosphate isomerase/epimerase
VTPAAPRRGFALCGRTLPQASFTERVELAARHGFTHVSLMGHDARSILDGDVPAAEVRSLLDRHGIAVAELDAVVSWLPTVEPLPDAMRPPVDEGEFCAVADLLAGPAGTPVLNVVDLVAGPTPPIDECAGAFAAVCDRAAAHDLRAAVEFVPWTRIPDLATAVAIVERAGRPNGGVMFDTWHHFRGGGTAADLAAVPAELIIALQVNDAPEAERGARVAQPVQHRLLPGDGVIGVAEILADLDERGCTAPIGLEVTSAELAALPADEVMTRLAASAHCVAPWVTP